MRILFKGFLYPLGHRAEYEMNVLRTTDCSADNSAELRSITRLTVLEPTRSPSPDPRIRRAFPFDTVEITKTVYTNVAFRPDWQPVTLPSGDQVETYCRVATAEGIDIPFPISCSTPRGPIQFEIPLLFVKDLPAVSITDAVLAEALRTSYDTVLVTIPPTRIELVRAPESEAGDVHQVLSFALGGSEILGDPRPELRTINLELPALRTLIGHDAIHPFEFTRAYLDNGEGAAAFLGLPNEHTIDINFLAQTDRAGALAAPRYTVNAISRIDGPMKATGAALSDVVTDPRSLFSDDATLLGFPLRDLVRDISGPPRITAQLEPGHPPTVTMEWKDIALNDQSGFIGSSGGRLNISVKASPSGTMTLCTIDRFALRFPTVDPVLELSFEQLKFVRRTGPESNASDRGGTELEITGLNAELIGKLKLLEDLKKAVSVVDAGPQVDLSPRGVSVKYLLPLPAASAGVFVMRNIVFRAGVDVPFDGDPVEVTLGFASKESPFVLTVMAFGGGGYADLAVTHDGLRRLEVALEFGALVAVDFIIASGQAHILGGVRITHDSASDSVAITGYLRIGGSLDILGLVSVSIELRLELTYESDTNALVGRATMIIEIDILFFSESVELDSGEWRLMGGKAPRQRSAALGFAAASSRDRFERAFENWRAYRRCFAPDPVD